MSKVKTVTYDKAIPEAKRVYVYCEPELHRKLRILAVTEGTTMTHICRQAILEYLERIERGDSRDE